MMHWNEAGGHADAQVMVVASIASPIPAIRATRVDAARALRAE